MTRRARLGPAILLALSLSVGAVAGDPAALGVLFPDEADVLVEGSGPARLDLPPEVLAACRPDLSNVRLSDTEGNEISFPLDAPRLQGVREVETVTARQLEVLRESGPPLRRDEG